MASLDDLATFAKLRNEILAAIKTAIGLQTTAFQNAFPRINGTFTLAAAATTTVANTSVTSTSKIFLMPTNAAAATLMGGAKALYVSARTPGASFAVTTANAAAAAGTETFEFILVNPS